jgi:phage tail sheath gpL-like
MGVQFDTISSGKRTNSSHFEVNNSRAVQGLNRKPSKLLIIGRKLTTGSVAELVPKRVLSGDHADAMFGVGSELAEMCRAAKVANNASDMWAIASDPLTTGTAGTKTLTVTVTTALAGTIHLYIAGLWYVPVAVDAGQIDDDIAAAIVAAIQAHRGYARMPFTVAAAENVVIFTMKWKGVDVADVRCNYNNSDAFPGGVSVAIAAGAAGAGNPDISEVVTAMGSIEWYDTIANPYRDATNLHLLEEELLRRFGGEVQKDCQAFSAVPGNFGTASTLGESRNSPFLSIVGASTSPTPPWIWAAVAAAVDAGEPDPAVPRQGVTYPGVLPAAVSDQWDEATRELLLYSGISTHTVDAGGHVIVDRVITTYRTNSQGVPDESYLSIETMRTLSAIRYDARTSVLLAFPRYKLANDGAKLPPGQKIMTPSLMKGHLVSRYDLWGQQGWVEIASRQQFIDELVCMRDPANVDRLQAQLGPNLMNQFRGIDAQIAFIL